jgi:hypothetical protein
VGLNPKKNSIDSLIFSNRELLPFSGAVVVGEGFDVDAASCVARQEGFLLAGYGGAPVGDLDVNGFR